MKAIELFRGATIDVATNVGILPVDGLSHGCFHVRPGVVFGGLVWWITHIPTGMRIPRDFSSLSAACDAVVDMMGMDFDWISATADCVRARRNDIIDLLQKHLEAA